MNKLRIHFAKLWRLSASLLLSLVLAVSAPANAYNGAVAHAAVGLTLYEILQLILLTAGVTIGISEGVDRIVNPPETMYDDAYLAVIAGMNEDSASLGDRIDEVVSNAWQTAQAGRETVITISQDLWDALGSWAQARISGGSIEYGNISSAISLSGYQDIESALGIQVSDSNSQGRSNLDDFLSFVSENGGLVTCIAYGGLSTLASDGYNYILVSPQSAVDVTAAIQLKSMFYRYLYLYSGGASVPFVSGELRLNTDGTYRFTWNDVYSAQLPLTAAGTAVYPEGDFTWRVSFSNSAVSYPLSGGVPDIFKDAVTAHQYDVVTRGRTWDGEAGALAGSIAITIPTTYPVADRLSGVLDGTIPAADVLEDVGVIPVDTELDKAITMDKTIAQTVEDAKAADVSIGGFLTDLKTLFPFCIPFDFADFIGVLNAAPVAPVFEFKFPVPGASGITYYTAEVSLEPFNSVAAVCRTMELLAFIIGLVMITRSHMVRS